MTEFIRLGEDTFGKKKSEQRPPLERQIQLGNHLIPEFELPEDLIEEIKGLSLDELHLKARTRNALRRNAIWTVGHVLESTREELLASRGFGLGAVLDLGIQLQILFDLPEETCPSGAITEQIVFSLPSYQRKGVDISVLNAGVIYQNNTRSNNRRR